MPASENEAVAVASHKKSKKSKKVKLEAVEDEDVVVEEANGHDQLKDEIKQILEEGVTEEDENLMKKKKKKNKKAADEEKEEEAENGNGNGKAATVDFSDDASVNKAVTSISEVSEELIEQFRSAAQKVVKKNKGDAIAPLAAAIAIMSGATKVVTKSILTQREGYTTYSLTKYDDEIRGKSFAFVIIKRILGEEEGDQAVSHLKFTADRKVCDPTAI